MAESKQPQRNDLGKDGTLLMHAFRLLAAAELGKQPSWAGPDDELQLRTRVELLAVLLNIIPRSELNRLGAEAESWKGQFSEQQMVTPAQLREVARAILNLPAEPTAPSDRESAGLRRALAI